VDEDPAPSLAEVARRIGAAPETLRGIDRNMSKAIVARYAERRRAGMHIKGSVVQHDTATLEAAARDATDRDVVPSMTAFASELGYRGCSALHHRVPGVGQMLKRAREKALEQRALEVFRSVQPEDPPLTLLQLARRAGICSEATLKKKWPEVCASQSLRRLKWIESARDRQREALIPATTEEPPPSPLDVCRRLAISRSYLRKWFPDINRTLSIRWRTRETEAAQQRHQLLAQEVRNAVFRLFDLGIPPLLKTILAELDPDLVIMDWRLISQARADAVKEIGRRIPGLNP